MAFTLNDVKTLREKTGCGMMDCKKALTEADGDMDKAIDVLREKGKATAQKKAGRIAAEGAIVSYIDDAKKVGVLVEVNAETDFVAKNDKFVNYAKLCAKMVAEKNPADNDELMAIVPEGEKYTLGEMLTDLINTIRENIKFRRFVRFEGNTATYIHDKGRIGVMVLFDTTNDIAAKDEFKAAAQDVCMQIAAMNPSYLNQASVPAEVIDHEKGIMTEQVINEGKPAAIAEKIVMGKMGKFYKENCLVEQAFVKDNNLNIQQYLDTVAGKGAVKVAEFIRFERGEGLQKREDNFAEEIASMM